MTDIEAGTVQNDIADVRAAWAPFYPQTVTAEAAALRVCTAYEALAAELATSRAKHAEKIDAYVADLAAARAREAALIEDRAHLQVELQVARGEGGHTVCGDPQPFPPYTGRCELPAGHLTEDPNEPAHRCGNNMWGTYQ